MVLQHSSMENPYVRIKLNTCYCMQMKGFPTELCCNTTTSNLFHNFLLLGSLLLFEIFNTLVCLVIFIIAYSYMVTRRMHDCCIRVTALLECFEWTLNKPQNRTGSMASTKLSMPSGWGLTFGAISFYYVLSLWGCIPSHSIIIGIEGAWSLCF